MSLFGLRAGSHVLIVGVEPDPEEPDLTRVYIDARYLCKYVLCSGESAESVRRAWGSSGHHVTCPTPESYYVDDEQLAHIARHNAKAADDFERIGHTDKENNE